MTVVPDRSTSTRSTPGADPSASQVPCLEATANFAAKAISSTTSLETCPEQTASVSTSTQPMMAPPSRADLSLDGGSAPPPLSVSTRLPDGTMYTHKTAFPASGTLRVGGSEFSFDPTRDLAILDEHQSALPYQTRWVWGTYALQTPEGTGRRQLRRTSTHRRPGGRVMSVDTFRLRATIRHQLRAGIRRPLSRWHVTSADDVST